MPGGTHKKGGVRDEYMDLFSRYFRKWIPDGYHSSFIFVSGGLNSCHSTDSIGYIISLHNGKRDISENRLSDC
jgi:hypothetical protein